MSLKAVVSIWCMAFAVLGVPRVSLAVEGGAPETPAQGAFARGRRLASEGHYLEAATEFAESERFDPAPGTMIALAYCYEMMGKTASAWALYEAAADQAQRDGSVESAATARAQAQRLESVTPRLAVQVTPQPGMNDVVVDLDQIPLPPVAWGRPMPIDLATHEVRVIAPRKPTWIRTFTIHEGDSTLVSVVVPDLEPQAPPPLPPPSRDNGRRVAAFVLGAGGVTAIAASAVLGLTAKATMDGAECENGLCTRSGGDAQSRAYTEAGIATVSAVTGGIAVASALVLWLWAPDRRVQVQPTVGKGALGLDLQEAW